MAVDRLMTLRLVSADAIVGWVFGSEGVTALGDESLSGAAWEILYNAVNKTIARVQVGAGVRGVQGVCGLAARWGCCAGVHGAGWLGGGLAGFGGAGAGIHCLFCSTTTCQHLSTNAHCLRLPNCLLQDAREDLAASEALVVHLQAQVEALVAAEQLAAEAAAQLEAAVAAVEVRAGCLWCTAGEGEAAVKRCRVACMPIHTPLCMPPTTSRLQHCSPILLPPLPLPQEKRAYVVETEAQQQGAFLQVMRCFVQVLSSGHGTAVGDAMDTGGGVGGGGVGGPGGGALAG